MMKLIIKTHDGRYYEPVVEGAVTVTWTAPLSAGKLVCKIVKDDVISYNEGDALLLLADDKPFFYGYIFSKSRTGEQMITTTAYDQLIYLSNKDTYQYEDWTLSELLSNIVDDQLLVKGDITASEYVITGRVEQNKSYKDMLMTALNLTTAHEGMLYTIYDDGGHISMKTPLEMKIPLDQAVTYDNTVDFQYQTDIMNASNRIKIKKPDQTYHIEEDKKKIARWGLLQFYAEAGEADESIEGKAKILLELLNRTHRKLRITKTVGNLAVRAGSLVPVVFMAIGDINVQSYMYVQQVVHTFDSGHHWMALDVYNKDILPQATGQGAFTGGTKGTKGAGGSSGMGGRRGAFVDYCKAQVGKRYSQAERFAADAFDCSSLVLRGTQAIGLDSTGSNMTTYTMPTDPRYVQIPWDEKQPGDILWNQEHVAIYLGGNETVEARGRAYGVCYATVDNRFRRAYRIKGVDG